MIDLKALLKDAEVNDELSEILHFLEESSREETSLNLTEIPDLDGKSENRERVEAINRYRLFKSELQKKK